MNTSILTTYRGLSPAAIEARGVDQLSMDRIQIGEVREEAWGTMTRLQNLADTGKELRGAQRADFDAAEKIVREASPLFEKVDTLIRDSEAAARSEANEYISRGRAFGDRGFSDGYAEGRGLTRGQSFEGYVRSRGLTDRDGGHFDGDRGLDLGKYLRGLATGEWDNADAERRAMSEGTDSAGGFAVPTVLAAQMVDLARNQTRVMQAGALLVPMETKTVSVAKWTGDPAATWHSENGVITPDDGELGSVSLTAKSLAALVVASRELLEDASNIENALREAFAAQFALTLDKAALYGSGTAPEPRGVKNTSGVTTTSLGTDGAAPTWANLIDAVGALEDVNESPNAQIMAPRTARALAKQVDSTGQYIAPPSFLSDVSRLSTNQVPVNLTEGTSTDASDIFTADWRQLYIGIRTGLQIEVLRERYADNGQLGFLCWFRGDVAAARAAAFHVQTGALGA